ncbi:MAG TPA: signal peptidase I [Bdellovibrionota bacterium]|nr:signal peptidase I [Bdellovibrionota bacterium]
MAQSGGRSLVKEYGTTVLAAIAFALLIRFFIVEAYRIPSPAMKPTLEPGDTIFVSKWPYGLRVPGIDKPLTQGELPGRGDVVIFSMPQDPRRDYIKRVIALPGDQIAMRKGEAILNGKTLRVEPATTQPCTQERTPDGRSYGVCAEPPLLDDFGPETVPKGHVFVVGDFRARERAVEIKTRDRRPKGWGMVPLESLKGRALWVWLSVEPQAAGMSSTWFPQFRFQRMFRRVE